MEDDAIEALTAKLEWIFQSTSSVWRTTTQGRKRKSKEDISIHVLRVEDDQNPDYIKQPGEISIHVLRVEDDCIYPSPCRCAAISIHVLRVEDDEAASPVRLPVFRFQSTSSVWRTTI